MQRPTVNLAHVHLFVLLGGVFWSGWNFPAWCSGGRRPLIAGCLSIQRLGIDLPVTCPAWDSNLRPPASESRPLTNLASVHVLTGARMRGWRNTVELVLLQISNSMKPYPSAFHAHASTLRPAIGFFDPRKTR